MECNSLVEREPGHQPVLVVNVGPERTDPLGTETFLRQIGKFQYH